MNYYNENDPRAAAWLRELIKHGHIPEGFVDERSIVDVRPGDLGRYTQCHFFAGIGGWPYALTIAGFPADRPVWTGSCPCQPFSCAGKQNGTADIRHLWPEFARLIRVCRPPTVFGEQVASKAGRGWLAGVFSDVEKLGYACAGADLCAAGVGAPHIRQRLYWVADLPVIGCGQRGANSGGRREGAIAPQERRGPVLGSQIEWMDDAAIPRCAGERGCEPLGSARNDTRLFEFAGSSASRAMAHDDGERCAQWAQPIGGALQSGEQASRRSDACGCGINGRLGNSESLRDRTASVTGIDSEIEGKRRERFTGGSSAWDDFELLICTDGKARRVEPGVQPLAHGVSGRVAQLRGLGNAIVPQIAAEFVNAWIETKG